MKPHWSANMLEGAMIGALCFVGAVAAPALLAGEMGKLAGRGGLLKQAGAAIVH